MSRHRREVLIGAGASALLARGAYQQDFLAVSPVIADYLHRELLHLANDDASLLGPDYPGSMS